MQPPLFPTVPDRQAQTTRPYSIPVYRVTLVRNGSVPYATAQIRSAASAVPILQQYLDGVDREHFCVVLLDHKNKVIGINTVSMGSLTASVVHPREVLKPAILSNAASIILSHNHPGGDPQPSREDRALTKRLVEAGKLLGITVLDHLILGDGCALPGRLAASPPRLAVWPSRDQNSTAKGF